MSKAAIAGNNTALRIPQGISVLPVGSITFSSNVVQVGNGFQITDLGDYELTVQLLCAGVMSDVPFDLVLYNVTTNSPVQTWRRTAPNLGYFDTVEVAFCFTVTNPAHVYQVRVQTVDNIVGEPSNAINLQSPQWRACLGFFGGGSPIGPGTVNTVPKFTAPNAIGDSSITDDGTLVTVNSNARVLGDLTVTGNIVAVDTVHLLIQDNTIYENNGYVTPVARTGGLAVNYLPTAVVDTVAAGGFTAGVPAVSNPTVATTGAATFAPGDLIQISGATNPENNGLFEVQAHAANLLTIRGVGVAAAVEDFTQTQFATDATVAGVVTQVTVSVMRAGTDGIWESARGAVTGFAFVDVLSGAGTNNTLPKFTGAGTLADSRISDDATTVQLTPEFRERIGAAPAAFAAAAGAGADVYLRTQDAFPTSAAKGGDLIITVGAGDGVGRNGSVSVPGAGAGSEIFGLGSASAGANSVAIGAGSSTTAALSVAVGQGAICGGANGVVVGAGAAATMTNQDNVVIGQGAASSMTTSQDCTVIGQACAATLATGASVVLVGESSDTAAADTNNAVGIGNLTKVAATGVAVGMSASVNVTGADNTVLGYAAAPTLVAGLRNTVVGSGGDVGTAGTNDGVRVGALGAVAVNGVSMGSGASMAVTGTDNVVVGKDAAPTLVAGTNNVVLGTNADVAAAGTNLSVVVGDGAKAAVNGVTVGMGSGINVTGTDNIVIGQGAAVSLVDGTDNVLIGTAVAPTLVSGARNVVIGDAADVTAVAVTDGVAIGNATSIITYGVAVGSFAVASGVSGSISIGALSDATGISSIALGGSSQAVHNYTIALGYGATTTAANQMIVGAQTNFPLSESYWGQGKTSSAPTAFTFAVTEALTTSNLNGADLKFQTGRSTGTGASGDFIWRGSPAGAAGATQNTLYDYLKQRPAVVSAAFAHPTTDTAGVDTFWRTMSGGTHSAANPRGGDWNVQLGAAGAGGTGRPGYYRITGDGSTLTLPIKSGAGDPSADLVSGMLYYNSNSNKFRAYENGAWVNMIGAESVRYISLDSPAWWPSTTSGCAALAQTELGTNDVDIQTLDFDQTTQEYAQISFVLPANYSGGTVKARVYWTAAAGSATQTVIWGVQGRSYADDDAIDQAWGTAQEVSDALIATDDEHITSQTAAITLAGTPAANQRVQLRLYRKSGSDTLAADAKLISVQLEYGIA